MASKKLLFLISLAISTLFSASRESAVLPGDYDLSSIPPLDTVLIRQDRIDTEAKTLDSFKKMVQDVVDESASKEPNPRKKRRNRAAEKKIPKKIIKNALQSLMLNNTLAQRSADAQNISDVLEKQYQDLELENKTVSLKLKKTGIKEALISIGQSCDMQFIIDADITGTVPDLELKKMPLPAVLHSILQSNDPRLALVKMFGVWRIMKMQAAREMFTGIAMREREKDFSTSVICIVNAKWNDALKLRIEKLWQGITCNKGVDKQNIYLVLDEVNKKVFCKARKAQVEEFACYLKEIDIAIPQIRIEARVVLANKDFEESLGFNWSGVYNRRASVKRTDFIGLGPIDKVTGDGTDKNTTPFNDILGWTMNMLPTTMTAIQNTITIPFIFGNQDMATKRLNLQLNAAENRNELKTILKPSLLVFNEEVAEILVGEELPHEVRLDETIEGKLTNVNTINYKDIGMKITVKPAVAAGHESVFLDVFVENSMVTKSDFPAEGVGTVGPNGSRFNYTIQTARSKNRVLLKSGQTTLIGGLIECSRETAKTGVPYLQDVPVLGWFFKGNQKKQIDKQLLIFITPTLVC